VAAPRSATPAEAQNLARGRKALLVSAAAVLAIVVWATVVFGRVLFGPWALFWHDVSITNIPLRLCLKQAIAAGHFPFWSWLLGSGYPVGSDPQACLAYPLQAFDLLPWISPERAYAVSAWLHVILAGMGVWALLGVYRLSAAARLLAALAYMGSGFMAGHVMHEHVIFAAAWLPWALAGLTWLWQGPSVPRAILAGLPLGLSLLAGQPQFALYSLVAYALWALLAPLPDGKVGRAQAVGWGLLSAGFGLALGMGPYLTGRGLFAASKRAVTGPGNGGVFNMALDPAYWPLIVQPFLYGSYAENNYFGGAHHYEVCGFIAAPVLALALFGLVAVPQERRRLVAVCAALALVALLMAAARQNPLYDGLRRLPLLGSFRAHARWVMVFGLGAALLGGLGLEALAQRRWRGVAAMLGVLLLLGWVTVPIAARAMRGPAIKALAARVPDEAPSAGDPKAKATEKYSYILSRLSLRDPYWAGCGVGALALLLAAWLPALGVAVCLAATALLGGLYFSSYLPAVPLDYYRTPPSTAQAIARAPGPVWVDPAVPENLRPPRTYRGWAREGTGYYMAEREVLRPNRPVLWGLESAQCNDALALADQVQVLDDLVPALLADARTRPAGYTLLASLGVRWAVTLPDRGPAGAAPVARTMQSALFAVPDAQSQVRLCAGIAHPCAGRVDPASAELLRSPRDILIADRMRARAWSGEGQVRAERKAGPDLLAADVDARKPGLLLLGMPAHPVLLASVDGTPAAITRYDGYLAAVAVPAGRHRVGVSLDIRLLRAGLQLLDTAWFIFAIAFIAHVYYAGRRTLRMSRP
jgi:hypothetical protein